MNRYLRAISLGVGVAFSASAQQPTPPGKPAPPVVPIVKQPSPMQPPPQVVVPSAEDQARAAFKKGVEAFQQKQFDQAATALQQVPELGGYLSLYKHWFLGQAYLELGKYKESEPEFAKVIESKASSELKYQAQFNMGEAALRDKKYAEAEKRLQPLERKWRHSYRYPEVLYRLMVADLRMSHTANACKRARKLYAKYPAHGSVIAWGSDLSSAQVDGKRLPCANSKEDFSDRVRSLQWAGESDKALKELNALLANVKIDDRLRLDLILANFQVNEGAVDEALKVLVPYYPMQKSNMAYLTLLGKAAARSGEYQTAVGAFERAYSLSPNSKKGREALFQAAYLSYQFQDYDGAVRKFQQFMKRNPRSGLARDAQWHLAWLQYLRADYRGAIEKFAQAASVSRKRRSSGDSLQERLAYWSGMAHIRLNEFTLARVAFDSIVTHNPYSYYGLAAQARLESIKDKSDVMTPRTMMTLQPQPMEGSEEATVTDSPSAPERKTAAEAKPEEQESEETISDSVAGGDDEVTVVAEEGDEEAIQPSDFKDPALRARIDVAQKLISLGLPELARWELYEVEKRTRNKQYLRMLLQAYEGINSYHRSAGIAELNFVKERENGGLDGARSLWVSMYPQAYKKSVETWTKKYSIPQEWAWAIMRTESLYKTDVISPVGAKGLMQLMPFTARNLYKLSGETVPDNIDLLNPDVNIRLGSQYLARLMLKFNGQLPLVAAAYNSGPHRVESWLVSFGHLETDEFVEHIPFLETRNYVKKVVRNNTLYRRIYAQDQAPVASLAKSLGVPIPSRASTRETWETM